MPHGHGTVVALEGRHAIVLFRREADGPCVACPGTDLCATIPPEECERKVRAVNGMGAAPGETVSVRLPDDGRLGWAFVHVFGFPLVAAGLGLVGAAALARAAGLSAAAVQAAAFLGLAGALVGWIPVGRFLDRIRREERMFMPEVEPPRELPTGCGVLASRGKSSCFSPDSTADCRWGDEPARLPER